MGWGPGVEFGADVWGASEMGTETARKYIHPS